MPHTGTEPASRLLIHTAAKTELLEILQLQREESNRVGFLPKTAVVEHIERGWCLTARFDGDLIGYVLGWRRMRYAPWCRGVTQLIVQRRFRRCGVARMLLQRYADLAAAAGQVCLQAWTRVDLFDAHAMWKKLRWTAIAIRTPTTARGKPAVLLRLSLTAIPHPDFFSIPTRGGWNAAAITAQKVVRHRRSASRPADAKEGQRALSPRPGHVL